MALLFSLYLEVLVSKVTLKELIHVISVVGSTSQGQISCIFKKNLVLGSFERGIALCHFREGSTVLLALLPHFIY
jgi:hypothetical protein